MIIIAYRISRCISRDLKTFTKKTCSENPALNNHTSNHAQLNIITNNIQSRF